MTSEGRRAARRPGSVAQSAGAGPVIPRATYRVQLNAGFDFGR